MEAECALAAGKDPRRHALLLLRLWEAELAGSRPPTAPRPLIAESWARVRRSRLDPYRGRELDPVPFAEVEERRQASRLREVIDILRDGLVSFADDGLHVMVITDAEGHVLWHEGNSSVRSKAEAVGLVEGARWTETDVGTSSIGTALVLRRPTQIFAAEHFVRTHHPWVGSSAPVFDPADGRLLGIVGVSGPAVTVHPSTLALVASTGRLAEAALRSACYAELSVLRACAAPVLALIREPALVCDVNGWVAAASGMRPPDRVRLPDQMHDAGQAYISAIGWCTFEPLSAGWLLRVGKEELDHPSVVRLDLSGPVPSLVAVGAVSEWRYVLSPRHAELLFLLSRHPEGRSAMELSHDLFGDANHTATVRAELSRLRRRIGSLISQRPYRFPPWLAVVCDLPDDSMALLPSSMAPAVRSMRHDDAAPPGGEAPVTPLPARGGP